MTIAWSTNKATAISITSKLKGFVTNPSEIIRVVAPAGACSDLSAIIMAPVAASDNAAAKVRARLTPISIVGIALVRPQTQSAPNPQIIPIAWPKIVCLGLAAGISGA